MRVEASSSPPLHPHEILAVRFGSGEGADDGGGLWVAVRQSRSFRDDTSSLRDIRRI